MTDPTAATPLDLADMRARAGNLAPYEVRMDTIALCEEVERLRAENADYALQIREADIEGHQLDAMRPVVEAARAWDKWVREVVQAPPGALDGYEVSLSVAVAAYEQEQSGSQPSDIGATSESRALRDEPVTPAAGDQRPFCAECGAYLNEAGFAVPWVDAETHATIARLEADSDNQRLAIERKSEIVERLRAENARLTAQPNLDVTLSDVGPSAAQEIDRLMRELLAMRPAVEAAVALGAIAPDRDWENTVWVAHMDFWEEAERDALEALGHAVAEWEKHKVVQPSPVSASTGKEPSSDGEQSPAAGDQRCLVTHNLCGTDTWGSKPCTCDSCQRFVLRLLAERDATIARLRTALLAAADALEAVRAPLWKTTDHILALAAQVARDAARAAAQEGV